ncbi:iron ABC transporter permease [Mesobaculum littorinae]|uniref:Iron ABC transporter permease n=1 Tax=Mesobaculum littorinae TaxID=2486419 RepID=A0A438AIP3_9RHOB|nr:iron chelate uptake ABC transporter family permease subunit [Mesobaculum littorinae]RVV98570.1 iron ABC transporter permease [Mesobaculum littorinae]
MAARRLIPLALALGVASVLFLTLGARGSWSFVLGYRGQKLAALLIVGAAIAVSTVIFQTISGNRILTPSIMGFDALFVLLQTGLVFSLGGFGLAALSAEARFGLELLLLLAAALLLFGTLLGGRRQDIHRMILTGIIFGVMFRSVASFLQRMIDPNEFAVVQSASFARFTTIPTELLAISGVLCVAALAAAWAMRHRLDVLALGRDAAVSLGLPHRATVLAALTLTAVLVSVSTALVGPVTFFGLLVAALAHRITGDHRHAVLMPAAALLAGLVLVAGQTLVERVLDLSTTLSVVVEFAGGIVFLLLILREPKR